MELNLTAKKLDPKEEYCHTYSNFVVCLQSGYEEFMETSPVNYQFKNSY